MQPTTKNHIPSSREIEYTLQNAFTGLINEDLRERDRLFTNDSIAGLTIPVHGILYVMTEFGASKVPKEVKQFFKMRYKQNQSEYHATLDAEWPGLFCGLAGNILGLYCAVETGIVPEDAENTLTKSWLNSENLILSLAEGVAGQLLAAVLISQKAADLEVEEKMHHLMEFLLQRQAANGSWPLENPYLGDGAAGILLALMKYHQLYPDEKLKQAIQNGLNDIYSQFIFKAGSDSGKKAKEVTDISLTEGISGIALVLLYGAEMFDEGAYLTLAKKIAQGHSRRDQLL